MAKQSILADTSSIIALLKIRFDYLFSCYN